MEFRSSDTCELQITELADFWRERRWSVPPREHERGSCPAAYRVKLGRETIQLDIIAFRILRFLSANPYRAYTRRHIAEAVSSRRFPVAEEALDEHISVLRRQLGFFRDYVQSVPYIGYRFKA
jgi:DNA-binding response OmpR family regulator